MTILAAIDFSPVTQAVLEELPGLVEEGEEIILLHVAEPDPSFVGFDAGSDAVQEAWREQFRDEQATLDGAAEALRDKGVTVQVRMVRGAIGEEILRVADEAEVRHIVLGSHGHGLLYNMLVGSAAESVIRNAKVPVTLVPSATD